MSMRHSHISTLLPDCSSHPHQSGSVAAWNRLREVTLHLPFTVSQYVTCCLCLSPLIGSGGIILCQVLVAPLSPDFSSYLNQSGPSPYKVTPPLPTSLTNFLPR